MTNTPEETNTRRELTNTDDIGVGVGDLVAYQSESMDKEEESTVTRVSDVAIEFETGRLIGLGNYFRLVRKAAPDDLKPCAECGSMFEPRHHSAIYCCKECSKRAQNRNHKKRLGHADHTPRACEQCGQEYTPKRSDQRWCSKACSPYSTDAAEGKRAAALDLAREAAKRALAPPPPTPEPPTEPPPPPVIPPVPPEPRPEITTTAAFRRHFRTSMDAFLERVEQAAATTATMHRLLDVLETEETPGE